MTPIFQTGRGGARGRARILPIVLAMVVAAGGAAAESADAEDPMPLAADEADGIDDGTLGALRGWSPGLNVEFGIHAQELKATGSTTFGAGDGGTNTVSTLFARIETGVTSPPLAFLPGAPRIDVRGGGSIPLRETASTIISTQRIQGAEFGTDLGVSFKDMWHAAIDLRFDLPMLGRSIRVRPGFEYLQSRFRFEPAYTFRSQPTPGNSNPPTLDFKSRSDPDVHRFVGPTLAVEGNVLRVGPVAIDVFLQGRVYFLVGDRDTVVVQTDLLGSQTETSTSRMEANFIAGQVGFGIRGSF